ncbi:magnesium/cobalt transporter CorA [Gaoshiqia sediminis]|uniref:Magnesium transport protein CorA n=1 Tax=Gaoshiqia sediminis TaxID=2986998 RepID=A0AA42CA55_9BACT|nr:magnesium/cobalt transporter CorA [Gaoshiqia sediminis]MCW0483050.1 magnesium/cobalt transporter CorA [Gaoshiqia sediminis]
MKTLRNQKNSQLLNRKKQDPEKFIFTGTQPSGAVDIQLFRYNREQCIESKNLQPAQIERFEGNGFHYWLNVYGISDPAPIVSVCKKQGIHNLVIQDILDVNQRPKFQVFENFCFLTIKSTVPSNSDLMIEQISFVFGKNFLLSFQEKKADYFEHLRYRLRESKGILRERGSDYLLYTLLEAILDNYFKTLQQIDNEVEKLNFVDVKTDLSPLALEQIEQNKKSVLFIKKAILPIKEFTLIAEREENEYIEKRHLKYFLEIQDLCLTLLDNCDIILSTLESKTNLFFSVQGHRMNQVMKTLTIVATVFIPLTFIAGVYGMNFAHMPELQWKYGYAAVWLIMLLILAGMILYLRRKKWF